MKLSPLRKTKTAFSLLACVLCSSAAHALTPLPPSQVVGDNALVATTNLHPSLFPASFINGNPHVVEMSVMPARSGFTGVDAKTATGSAGDILVNVRRLLPQWMKNNAPPKNQPEPTTRCIINVYTVEIPSSMGGTRPDDYKGPATPEKLLFSMEIPRITRGIFASQENSSVYFGAGASSIIARLPSNLKLQLNSPDGVHLRVESVVHFVPARATISPLTEVGSADTVINLGNVNLVPNEMVSGSVGFVYRIKPAQPGDASQIAELHRVAQGALVNISEKMEAFWIAEFGSGSLSPFKEKWSWEKSGIMELGSPDTVAQFYSVYSGEIHRTESRQVWQSFDTLTRKLWATPIQTPSGTIIRTLEISDFMPNKVNVVDGPSISPVAGGIVKVPGFLKNGWASRVRLDYEPAYSGVRGSHFGRINAQVKMNNLAKNGTSNPRATEARLNLYIVTDVPSTTPSKPPTQRYDFAGSFPMIRSEISGHLEDYFTFEFDGKRIMQRGRDYMAEVVVTSTPENNTNPSAIVELAAADLMKLRFDRVNLVPLSSVDGAMNLTATVSPRPGLNPAQRAALNKRAATAIASASGAVRSFIRANSAGGTPEIGIPTKAPAWNIAENSPNPLTRIFTVRGSEIYTSGKGQFQADLNILSKQLNSTINTPEGRVNVSFKHYMPPADL